MVETDSDVTVNYSFNNLSDEKVKTNIADADLDTLQGIFDGAHPKTYDRTDIEHHNRLGFLAQDFLGAGVTGKTYRDGEELHRSSRRGWRPWRRRSGAAREARSIAGRGLEARSAGRGCACRG